MSELFYTAPYQTNFSIQTNDKTLYDALRLKYGTYLSEQPVWVNDDCRISVEKVGDHYIVHTTANSYSTVNPMYDVDHFLFTNMVYDSKIFALHGAAVEWHGQAYLFLASSTSGKTTLTSYLTSIGFGYITDDCIFLNRETLTVSPNASPIHLRDGGLEVLKRYHAEPENLQTLDAFSTRRHIYLPENRIKQDIPLKKIFFITRTEQKNKVADMSGSEKLEALMKAPITIYKITGEYIRFITRLAKVDCKYLFYSNMKYVAEVIRSGR